MPSQGVASHLVLLKMNFKKFFSGFPHVSPCVFDAITHNIAYLSRRAVNSKTVNQYVFIFVLRLHDKPLYFSAQIVAVRIRENWHNSIHPRVTWPLSFFWHQLCNSNGKEAVTSSYMLHEASTHVSFCLSLLNRLFKIIGQFLSKLKHRGQDYQYCWRAAILEYGVKTAGVLLQCCQRVSCLYCVLAWFTFLADLHHVWNFYQYHKTLIIPQSSDYILYFLLKGESVHEKKEQSLFFLLQ